MGSIAVSRGVAPSVRGVSGDDPSTQLAPAAQTDPADGISWNAATLHCTVQNYGQPCYVRFEWGATTAYGKVTPLVYVQASDFPQPVAATIAGLSPTTTYHFRPQATNGYGTGLGLDRSFVTQGYLGLTPLIVGAPPVMVPIGVADLAPTTVSMLGTVAAGAANSPAALPTTARVGLRRKGTGAAFAYYGSQSLTMSSLVPTMIPDANGVQATGLLEDTDYEFVIEAKNVKTSNEYIQSPYFSFHTPAAPPPPGNPPTCDTLSATALGGSTVAGSVRVNHNNAAAATGFSDVYVRHAKQSTPTQWTQLGPLNPPNSVAGTTNQDFTYQIDGLTASTAYYVWAHAVNNYGETDDFAGALSVTTGTGAVGTIQANVDFNWYGYNQATLRCKYTTPASGTFQIRFGYRTSGTGSAYTMLAYESVAISTTPADWDAVVGGLTPLTQYDFIGELFDGAVTVTFDAAGVFATAAAPSGINGTAPVFPGFGPGTRSGPIGQNGSPPTIQNIQTYRDARRPSSGLITRDNKRIFKPNIASHPTLGPTNKARFAAASDPAFVLTDGADIIVWGAGHGTLLTYPGNGVYAGSFPSTYDIEIWDPHICDALGTTQPPHVIRSGASNTNTTHTASSNAMAYAISRFGRNCDGVAAIGTLGEVSWCEETSQQKSVSFAVSGNPGKYYAMVGLWCAGLVAKSSVRAWAIGSNGGAKYGGQRGCVTNLHYKNLRVTSSGGIASAPFRHANPNVGANDPSIGYTLNSFGGLLGIYDLDGTAGAGARTYIRVQSGNFRYDFHEWDCDNTLEHQRYVDNPSALICGVEGGVAASSFTTNCRNRAGTLSPTGDGRSSDQIVARRVDNFTGSLYDCPTGCSNCANNTSIGPHGEGTFYFKNCTWITLPPLSAQIASFVSYGHHGLIHVEACTGNGAIAIIGESACNQQLRPVVGPDGNVYASSAVHIESFVFTGTDSGQGAITLDSCVKATVNMAGFTVPAGYAAARYPIEIASDGTDNFYVAPGTTTQHSIRPCGFVRLIGIATWIPPTSGKFVRYAKNGGPTSFTPPLIDKAYSAAERAVFEAGVCGPYLHAPLTQPGGHVCPNNV